MFGIGLFQMFCLPSLFGVFILSGFIYFRKEKNWLNNLVYGLIKIILGAVTALIGYGIASSTFPAESGSALYGLTQTGLIVTAAGILTGLVPSALGALEILRAIRRQSQGDESYVPFSLKEPEPVEPPRNTRKVKPHKKQPHPHK